MSWAVAFTKPASEQLAAHSIVESGSRAYCPMMQVVLRGHRQGKGESVLRPLFPRYIFAELTDGRFIAQRYARGVIDLIRASDHRPRTVSDQLIEELRARERGGAFDARNTAHKWIVGEMAAVESKWGTAIGKLVALDGDSRVVLLLSFLNREVRATVSLDKLRATA